MQTHVLADRAPIPTAPNILRISEPHKAVNPKLAKVFHIVVSAYLEAVATNGTLRATNYERMGARTQVPLPSFRIRPTVSDWTSDVVNIPRSALTDVQAAYLCHRYLNPRRRDLIYRSKPLQPDSEPALWPSRTFFDHKVRTGAAEAWLKAGLLPNLYFRAVSRNQDRVVQHAA